MGSFLGSGQGDDEFERADPSGPGGNPNGDTDEVFFEDRAAEASAWLAGCREARERGESDHGVGATGIADPVLAAMVDDLRAGVDKLVSYLPVGSDGRDLLETTVALNQQTDRLVAAKAHFAGSSKSEMKCVSGRAATPPPPDATSTTSSNTPTVALRRRRTAKRCAGPIT